jgi:Putative transposase
MQRLTIRVTTSYPDFPLTRQLPGSAGEWGNCRFVVDEPCGPCDWWVVASGLTKEETGYCDPAHTIFVANEPPNRTYPDAFLKQFAIVITCDQRVVHRGTLHSHYGLPWRAGVLAWPHSGFHVHTAVWIPEDDRAFAKRLARYCARNPVALERLTYDRAAKAVTYRSDKSEGPTAGTETADPLEFLARVLTHIPDKGQVTTRYYGWFANRPRGMRRRAEPAAADAPVPIVTAPRLAPTEATRRWAALLQQIFEVDPLSCPKCTGTMRIVAFITQSAVIDQILTHLRTRATSGDRRSARSPPSTAAPVARGASRASRRPPASTAPLHAP